MQVDVINLSGAKVGSVDVPDDVFGAEVSSALLWGQVKAQLASRRAGTHKTKKRGEVRGGGAKPFKQKGTGRARQGSSRSPTLVGGGTVFGPQPRDYSYRLPSSARKAALRSALSDRASNNDLVILEDGKLDVPKTKSVLSFLGALETNSALLVDAKNDTLMRSTRNIQKSKYVEAEAINVYDILNHQKLVLTKAALDAVVQKAQKRGVA